MTKIKAAPKPKPAPKMAIAGRKAIGVDKDIKTANLARLRRIEGQIRGIQKMVEDDRYCAEILHQIAAAQEALRAVGRELIRNHLKHCSTQAIRAGGEEASAMYDELVELFDRNYR
jgi:CsoR family transcriptional regulator, copper-sensing transcriptional repressor